MAAEHASGLVDDLPGARREAMAAEEYAVVVAGEEARLLALGATRDGESCRVGLGARLVLALFAEREPHAVEVPRVDRREHVRLVLRRIGGAREQKPVPVSRKTCVVSRRQPVRTGAAREREQLGEAEAAVAADARIRRLAALEATHERADDRAPEFLAQVERDVRRAERVTGLSRRDHRLGRAAGPLCIRTGRIEPEAERDADGVRQRAQERDRAVDAAAHRHGGPTGARPGTEDRPERVRECIGGERLARHGRGLEQRQTCQRPRETFRVRLDDPIAVDEQPDRGPLAVARRVSERLDHFEPGYAKGSRGSLSRAPPCRCRGPM